MALPILSGDKLQNSKHQNRKANGHDTKNSRTYSRTSVHPGSGPELTNTNRKQKVNEDEEEEKPQSFHNASIQ